MGQSHEGKCFGFIVLLLCFTSTFARSLFMDHLSMVKLHHEGMLELEPDHNAKPYVHELALEHGVIPKIGPIVVKLDKGQKFGSGTNLGYGFGRVACGNCGGVSTNLGGGDYPDHKEHKSDKGTMNMMRQAVAYTLP